MGCVAHKQLCRTVRVRRRLSFAISLPAVSFRDGTMAPDTSACFSKAGIIALFLAVEKCNSARVYVLCRCQSRIIGVYDTHVRVRMKKNRKGIEQTTPRDGIYNENGCHCKWKIPRSKLFQKWDQFLWLERFLSFLFFLICLYKTHSMHYVLSYYRDYDAKSHLDATFSREEENQLVATLVRAPKCSHRRFSVLFVMPVINS